MAVLLRGAISIALVVDSGILGGCSKGNSTSGVEELAAPVQVDPNAATATVAPIVYPVVHYQAIGDLEGQGHQFEVLQTLDANTDDHQVAFGISGFHVGPKSSGAQGAGQVNSALAPENGTTTYQRIDAATLAQLEATNPMYKDGDGALIYISGLTKNHTGRHYSFSPPVPFMPIPSSPGSYSGIGGGLSFSTTVNWGARDHPAQVTVSQVASSAEATMIEIHMKVEDDPTNIEDLPFPADARYFIDTVGERIPVIWTQTMSKSGWTKLYYQLCSSVLPDAGDPADFSNAACGVFPPGVINDPSLIALPGGSSLQIAAGGGGNLAQGATLASGNGATGSQGGNGPVTCRGPRGHVGSVPRGVCLAAGGTVLAD